MHDPLSMDILQGMGSLVEEFEGVLLRHSLVGLYEVKEGPIFGKLQQHVDHVFDLDAVHEADDVGVVEGLVDLDFLFEVGGVNWVDLQHVDLVSTLSTILRAYNL